jgi:exopolysaccharide biosynthesis operon protein EpsL
MGNGNRRNQAATSGKVHRVRMLALSLGLLSVTTPAMAFFDDQLQLFVNETVNSDSNVFRLSKNQDPRTVIGTSHKSDLYTTTSVGFSVDAPVSLQRFQFGYNFNRTHYHRFSDLDNDGHDGRAAWLWQVGDRLNGQWGYTESQRLASFLDIQGTSANSVTIKRHFGNATYMLTPRWELQAGVAEETWKNSNPSFQENDVDLSNAETSISYVSPSKNRIGLSLRQQDADFRQPEFISGSPVVNDYKHRSLGVVTDWNITAKSHLNLRVDHANRDFDQSSRQDYSGNTFRAAYDWKATGKFTLNVVAQRDINTIDDNTTNLVLAKGIALNPTLDLTDKIRLSASYDYSNREYLDDPVQPDRVDHVRTSTAAIFYRPARLFTVSLSGQHLKRSSNVFLGDTSYNLISLNARIAF